jgi:hypothetical protein
LRSLKVPLGPARRPSSLPLISIHRFDRLFP